MVAGWIYASQRTEIRVRAINPSYRDIRSEVASTGIVTPANDFPARANFTGLVEKVFVHVGEKVRPGQLLIRMKDQYAIPRLAAARAALDASEMNSDNVQQNGSQEDRIAFAADMSRAQEEQSQAAHALENMEQLQESGSVTQAEVDAATQRLDAANSSVEALQERQTHRYSALDIQSWKAKVNADRASLAAEKISYGNANITTPIAGTVYSLAVNPYDFVNAGTDLLHVADLSHIEVRAEFEEPDMAKISVGDPADVTWDGKPGRVWHGKLAAKPLAVVRSGERSVGKCILSLDDDHGDLPIDTNVSIAVITDEHRNVLTIPREALHSEDAAHFVFRLEGGRLVKTPVQTGLVNAMFAEIVKGLERKDVVALHSMDGEELSEGLRVAGIR
jgi:HlyD family secretion protein